MAKHDEIYMSFNADEKMLEDIRQSVSDVLVKVELSNKEKNGILLAIEEACTNVIRHAYLYAPGTIRIRIKLLPTKVVFSIFDKGRKFDFDHTDTPDLNRYVKTGRKGGLGLYLIRKMMDSVDYYSRDNENELRMSKKITPRKKFSMTPSGLSIRLKFAMWASLVVCLIIGTISIYYYKKNSATITERFFDQAINMAQTIALNASDKIVVGNELELSGLTRTAVQGNPTLCYITIVDNKNTIWADALSPQKLLSEYEPPAGVDITKAAQFQLYTNQEHGEVYHLVKEIIISGSKLGTIHLGYSEAELAEQIRQARRSVILFALIGLAVGLGAVYLLSDYFVKPIQKITEGVLKIGQGDLEEILPVEGSDEFSEIARAFNEITNKFKKAQDSVVEQEILQKEMQVAQEIQHALLPNRFPEMDGYELAAVYRAAKDVGGDYFDFVWIDEDTLGIAVADVSGKGVPGSLVMTMIRTAIRLEARGNKSPSEILDKVNKFVADDVKKGMFITIFFIILDSKNRQISFASAGHNPMILFRKDTEKCYFLNPKGMPLGLTLPDDISFGGSLKTDNLKLKKDDLLVIYTDGITEAMNKRSEQYGNDRLIEFIKLNSHLSPNDFAEALDKDLVKFTGNAPQNDDITLVVVKEKIMVDELIMEKRKRLLDMVEIEGKSIEDACEEMEVSVATFYKYRRRYQEEGEKGLLNKRLRADAAIRQFPYSARKKLLDIIRENPEFGATRLQKQLEEIGEKFTTKNIYDELVGLRLNTKKMRLAYIDRMGQLKPEQKLELEKEMLKEAEKQQSREEYADDLKKNIEKRHIEKLTSDTGRVITQLKQLRPSIGNRDVYKEIAGELGKLEGGAEISKLFSSLMERLDEPAVEPKPDEKAEAKPEMKPDAGTLPAVSTEQVERAEASQAQVSKQPEPAEKPVIEEETPSEKAEKRARSVEIRPVEATKSDEKIDIGRKAIKTEDEHTPLSDIDEYEKKLMKKFNK